MDYPIEIIYLFVGIALSLSITSLVAPNPNMKNGRSLPIVAFIAGALWIYLFVSTDVIILGYTDNLPTGERTVFTIGLDSEVHYNVTGISDISLYASQPRVGIKASTGSALIGDTFDSVTFNLKKGVGSPTGNIVAVLRNNADSIISTSSNSVSAGTLTSSYVYYEFTFDSLITITENSRILAEFTGGDVSNQVFVARTANGVNAFDGVNTHQTHFTTGSGGIYTDTTTQDVTGIIQIENDCINCDAETKTIEYSDVEPIEFAFTAFLKMAFLMIGASLMLMGALMQKFG